MDNESQAHIHSHCNYWLPQIISVVIVTILVILLLELHFGKMETCQCTMSSVTAHLSSAPIRRDWVKADYWNKDKIVSGSLMWQNPHQSEVTVIFMWLAITDIESHGELSVNGLQSEVTVIVLWLAIIDIESHGEMSVNQDKTQKN